MNDCSQAMPVGFSPAGSKFSHNRLESIVGCRRRVRTEDALNGRQIVCVCENQQLPRQVEIECQSGLMRAQSQRRLFRRERIDVDRENRAAAQPVAHPRRNHQCSASQATGRCLHLHGPFQAHRDLVGKVLVPVVRADASTEHGHSWGDPGASSPGDADRIQRLQCAGFGLRGPCGGRRCPTECTPWPVGLRRLTFFRPSRMPHSAATPSHSARSDLSSFCSSLRSRMR